MSKTIAERFTTASKERAKAQQKVVGLNDFIRNINFQLREKQSDADYHRLTKLKHEYTEAYDKAMKELVALG